MPHQQRNSSPFSYTRSSSPGLRRSSPEQNSSSQNNEEYRSLKRLCENLLTERQEAKEKTDDEESSYSRIDASSPEMSLCSPDDLKLGHGVPKLVSLFLPVAEIVEQSDKHIVLNGDDHGAIALVEAEFEGLDSRRR